MWGVGGRVVPMCQSKRRHDSHLAGELLQPYRDLGNQVPTLLDVAICKGDGRAGSGGAGGR